MTTDQPLRVFHLYAGNLYGGIETLLFTLARDRSLCPQMEPSFGLCFQGRLWSELTATGAAVHDLGQVRLSRPWTVLRARKRLKSILQTNQFDVVATHANWPHAVFAPMVQKLKRPLVNFVHDALKTRTWIDQFASATKPDLIIANSNYSAKFVKDVFSNPITKVIYYPVHCKPKECHIKNRAAIRAAQNTSDDSIVIIQVSRMESWKGAHCTISALGMMRDCGRDWTAWIVGGAQRPEEVVYENQLKQLVQQFGIEAHVRFLGQRNDIPELLSASDIFCQPNTSPEPFGIVFIEALRAGLPVVTSNTGGGAEIVNERCGKVVPCNSIEILAQALTLLFAPENRANPDDCRRRATELCDSESQMLKYYRAFTEMIAMLPKESASIKCKSVSKATI